MYVAILLVVWERRLHDTSPYFGLRECIVEYLLLCKGNKFGQSAITRIYGTEEFFLFNIIHQHIKLHFEYSVDNIWTVRWLLSWNGG